MNRISLDFETRSRADIKKTGAYRYAGDPSTEVLILALHDGTSMHTWDIRQPVEGNTAIEVLRRAILSGAEIHAFNSQFEYAILRYVCTRQMDLPEPSVEQMRCTAAVSRSAGMPPSLGKAAEFLELPVQKDKMGKALIQKFSVPQKKAPFVNAFIEHDSDTEFTAGGQRMTAAEAFQKFVDYCITDVETEMSVNAAMKPFWLKGKMLEAFTADARINARGVPVDVEALKHAHNLCLEFEKELTTRFRQITGLNPGQNAAVKAWLQERGYLGDSLNKESREKYGKGASLQPEAKEALNLKAALSYAAVKKIPAMLNWVMDDGYIRGAFQWYGAQKTGRWISKGPQFTNMKKPDKGLRKHIERLFSEVKGGIDLELLDLCYGDPYEVLASLSRYFVRFKDRMIYDLDFSSVEARILPMIIECDRILESFTSGEDIYVRTGKSLTKLLKDTFDVDMEVDRDTGKTCVLATQFQGGWTAVFNATGQTWNRKWCDATVKLIRSENPEFPAAWRLFQDSFIEALENPGTWVEATKYASFGYTTKAPFPRMMMKLPSGRHIVYPKPEKSPITMVLMPAPQGWIRRKGHLEEEYLPENAMNHFHTWELSFYGHTKGVNYGRVSTYGGDLLQSCTQATGVDLLTNGVIEAEKRGYEPFFLVHDQCLAPESGTPEDFTDALCTVPDWFKGFPLDADTDIVPSYCKG